MSIKHFDQVFNGCIFQDLIIESSWCEYIQCTFINCVVTSLEADCFQWCVFVDCDPLKDWTFLDNKHSHVSVSNWQHKRLHNLDNDLSYFDEQSKLLLN